MKNRKLIEQTRALKCTTNSTLSITMSSVFSGRLEGGPRLVHKSGEEICVHEQVGIRPNETRACIS